MVAIHSLSLSARVCSGVTDGTVIDVTVLAAAPGRWQQIEEQQAERFYSLGREYGGTVDGQQYTREQCYIKALELDDQHAKAWYSLGIWGGGNVGGQHYTKQQCHIQTLEIEKITSRHTLEWHRKQYHRLE